MKKLLILSALALFIFQSSQAQGIFKLGADIGLPTGDVADISDFKIAADVAYMVDLVGVAEIGGLVGYTHFFGKDSNNDLFSFEVDDFQFIPVAATGRFTLLPGMFLGTDLGYALGLNDGNDGGFYYRPQVGYNFLNFALVLSYSGVVIDETTISALNLGVELKL